MEYIKTFPVGSEDRNKLTAVASILNVFTNAEHGFVVRDVYFDYEQNLMWTTILCRKYYEDHEYSDYQCLTPAEQLDIISAESIDDLAKISYDILIINKELWCAETREEKNYD